MLLFIVSRKTKNCGKKWINAIQKKNWQPKKWSKLCSAHFLDADIDRTSLSTVRIREGVVPVLFPSVLKLHRADSSRKQSEEETRNPVQLNPPPEPELESQFQGHFIKTEVLNTEYGGSDTLSDEVAYEESKPTIIDRQMPRICLVDPADLMDNNLEQGNGMGHETEETRNLSKETELPRNLSQETEETMNLSTPELKRLVLLEQLKYYRKKQKLMDIKLHRELQREKEDTTPNHNSV